MLKVNNATVMITGASRGIGRALVTELLSKGAKKIYACARNIDSIENIKDDRVTPIALDISDDEQINAAAEITKDANILINNAGINTVGSLLHSDITKVPDDLNTNFLGTLKMIRAIFPTIEANKGGKIVNIISICGFAAMPSIGGYSVSKAALFSATQALRTELKDKNIQLVGVFPGPVDTDMNEGLDIEMASPESLAREIVEKLDSHEEDIFPDSIAKKVHQMWTENPKLLEVDFSKY